MPEMSTTIIKTSGGDSVTYRYIHMYRQHVHMYICTYVCTCVRMYWYTSYACQCRFLRIIKMRKILDPFSRGKRRSRIKSIERTLSPKNSFRFAVSCRVVSYRIVPIRPKVERKIINVKGGIDIITNKSIVR